MIVSEFAATTTVSEPALRIGLLSDLHLNMKYDDFMGPRVDAEGDCWATSGTPTDVQAPMGRYGCDPPASLIETMLDAFNDHHGKQDVIFLTGDFIAHHTALNDDLYPEGASIATQMETHMLIIEMLAEKFPDTLILPQFGNNDCEYHDNPEPLEDDKLFYEFIYDLWFDMLPGNKNSEILTPQLDKIKETFHYGGFYRVDLTDEVSVLAINTLFYDSERSDDIDTAPKGKAQLDWFEAQFAQDSTRKFIPISHVYAGARYGEFELWDKSAAKRYFDILHKHNAQVVMEFSGHDHFSSLRAHREEVNDKYHNIFIAPSITPWYKNNPGVTSLELSEDLVPHNLQSTFLNLNTTYGHDEPVPYEQLEFRWLDYSEQWGVDELTSKDIYQFS